MTNKNPWTKLEDELLIKFYSSKGPSVLARMLPGRTVNAVKNRAQALGLIFRQQMFGWTPEEIEILKTYYPIEGKRVADRLPGRTIKTIQITAHRAGIKRIFSK